MTLVWAAVLGVVQGLAEFLPISSSAHLALIPWLFRIQDPMLASLQFDIALHAGSFVAILVALWPDWVDLFKGALAGDRFKLRFLGFLLVTSVPGAIFGLLLEKQAETVFRSPLIVGVSIIVFGVLLWAVDRYMSRDEPMEKMTWLQAALIGLAQALAIVPGVSRSGATITAGRALGMSREAIARYSFMAALPIIGGAAVVGLRKVPMGELLSAPWIVGFIAAAISSVIAMRFMLRWVKTRSYGVFAVYRVAVGLLVIAVFFFRG
jgi:undecaprenyl-diphosphatase